MKEKEIRVKLQKACSCAMFLIIAGVLFVRTTYLFRNVGFDRAHIVGIKEEGPLDMVYIGGSAAFFFWQPLKAWKDYGFTSYNYATTTLQAEMIEPYVREVLGDQEPGLFVIGLRSFQYWHEDFFHVVGFRNGSDSMDMLSPDRLRMIGECLDSRPDMESEPAASYYLDIAKYHSNYREVLGSPEHWQYSGNDVVCPGKGWEHITKYVWLDRPTDLLTEERAVLPKKCEQILVDLLETCREKKLRVLFVVCPYVIEREDQMKYNAMKDLIEEYGFQYLNANEHYDEIGIDFTRDFYDISHVNCFGSEKYTDFLGKYIADTYQLPDHRGEPEYGDWEEAYEGFAQEVQTAKASTENLISSGQDVIRRAEEMLEQEDFTAWATLADSSAFGTVLVTEGQVPRTDFSGELMLQKLGIYGQITAEGQENLIVVHSPDAEEVYSSVSGVPQIYDGEVGTLSVHVEAGEGIVIQIGEKRYSTEKEGVYIAVVDLNRNKVVDCVVLGEGAGKAEIAHFQLIPALP